MRQRFSLVFTNGLVLTLLIRSKLKADYIALEENALRDRRIYDAGSPESVNYISEMISWKYSMLVMPGLQRARCFKFYVLLNAADHHLCPFNKGPTGVLFSWPWRPRKCVLHIREKFREKDKCDWYAAKSRPEVLKLTSCSAVLSMNLTFQWTIIYSWFISTQNKWGRNLSSR